ncbi:MAG TPA: hypothetical protein VGV40_05160, partial [Solirubrobacteraceae bacterium]|nr:hypothetical protein [Solirubrobacteraceae bacterium]
GGGGGAQCTDGVDNDGDGRVDFGSDPQCSSASDDSESGGPGGGGADAQCADGIDNDGDGRVDFGSDPQCSSRSDDSESDGGARAAGLPFSGTDVLGIVLAGALALAGGLLLRRRGELPGAP